VTGIDFLSLASGNIPDSVTSIDNRVFDGCTSLTSVTFQGANTFFWNDTFTSTFYGDLRKKYLAGGAGIYTTTAPVNEKSVWTKQ
jgi:hypothetical protein